MVLVITLHSSYLPTHNLSLTLSLLTLNIVSLFDSVLSFLVIFVQCYIGPCGVLVPTGTVHSNNEFEFEFEFINTYVSDSMVVLSM